MLVSWYLPTLGFSLWPCAILLLVFIPVSIWHERNWRRTLAAYAVERREAGATDENWPSPGLVHLMGVQPGLLLLASMMLGLMVGLAAWAALLWPRRPPGFELPVNSLDLPFLWSMITAGIAAVIAGVAIALDVRGNPLSRVAFLVRRAIYVSADERASRFAQALLVDPGVPRQASAPARGDGPFVPLDEPTRP
jgi:hypothetical protein